MAAHEIYDYLDATPVVPDYDAILDVGPQGVLWEDSAKNQVVYYGDDNSERVISFSDESIFYVRLLFNNIKESDAGTLLDWFNDPAKANGKARSFKWQDHGVSDIHTYTVRFASNVSRAIKVAYYYGFAEIKLKILGRAP